jgi:hypothetical protein
LYEGGLVRVTHKNASKILVSADGECFITTEPITLLICAKPPVFSICAIFASIVKAAKKRWAKVRKQAKKAVS